MTNNEQLQALLTAYHKTARFIREMDRLPDKSKAGWRYARYYNRIRREAAEVSPEQGLLDIIPDPIRYLPTRLMWFLTLLPLMISLIIAGLTAGTENGGTIATAAVLIAFLASLLYVGVALGSFYPSIQDVSHRASLLLAYTRENLAEVSPELAADLPPLPTQVSNNDVKAQPAENNTGSDTQAVESPSKPIPLAAAEQRHIQTQLNELAKQYDHLTGRIAALDTDIGRETDSDRRFTLTTRRQDFIEERDQLTGRMKQIEEQLRLGSQEPI